MAETTGRCPDCGNFCTLREGGFCHGCSPGYPPPTLAEIWKGHAEVWAAEKQFQFDLWTEDGCPENLKLHSLCTRIAERYQAKANKAEED